MLLLHLLLERSFAMRSLPLQRAIVLAFVTLALAACAGSGGAPPSATALAAPGIVAAGAATMPNVSGQYAGTVKDSVYGTGKASGDLAQYRSAAGGSLLTTYGSRTTTTSGAFTISGTSLRGTGAASVGTVSCVFDERATYDPSTHRLSGSYHSFHLCGGVTETGTFDLKQQCFYARNWIRNDAGGVKQC
jgi:hypothetical protein